MRFVSLSFSFSFCRLLFLFVLLDKHLDALFQYFHLGLQIIFVLEHGVMHAGPHEDKDQRGEHVSGDPDLGLQPLGIGAVTFVDTFEESLAVRQCILGACRPDT